MIRSMVIYPDWSTMPRRDTVQLTIYNSEDLTSPEKLEVLDTTYPHEKPQMLCWNVQSELNGEAMIQITGKADYVCIADAD